MADCRVYWGSHGCEKPRGHEGEHMCGHWEDVEGPCSVYDWHGVRYFRLDGTLSDPLPVEAFGEDVASV